MKKSLFTALGLVLVLILAATVGVSSPAKAEESQSAYKNTETYLFLKEFLENCPDRSGMANELHAATYLKGKFDEVLAIAGSSAQILQFHTDEVTGYNVSARLSCGKPNAAQIIIGAHYDSVGEGANDNASGVTALYSVMKTLSQNTAALPCDIVFVAFGAEESLFVGASYYLSNQMTSTERQSTLAMFNFDCIANGDNLYISAEGKPTDLASFILANAAGQVPLSEKPYATGTYAMDIYGYGYYERIQATDHTPFRLAGIPTVLFFSGTYSASLWDYAESEDDDKNLMNTTSDTLLLLQQNNGEMLVKRIDTVSQTVVKTVLAEGFLPVAENAVNQLVKLDVVYNSLWPMLAVVGLLILLAIGAVIHHRTLEKKALLGTADIKSDKVFATPDASDIFSFDDSQKQNDDIDDIFTFKK